MFRKGLGLAMTAAVTVAIVGGMLLVTNDASAESEEAFHHEFMKAVADYEKGQYEEAAHGFLTIVKSDATRGHVLYDLGNAWFKSGQEAHALAAYYGARRYLPRDPDVRANIKHLEKFAEDRLSSTATDPVWVQLFFWKDRFNRLELLSAVSLVLTLGLVLVGAGFFVPRLMRPLMVVGFLVLMLGGIGLSSYGVKSSYERVWGAVVEAEASVFSGRDAAAPVVFKLKSGAPVVVESSDGDWVRIALSDGKRGYMKSKDVMFF